MDEAGYTRKAAGWGRRIRAAFSGFSLFLSPFLVGTILLWWNEGNHVATGDAIAEARSRVESLPSVLRLDSSFEGRLAHAVGDSTTEDVLADNVFGVSAVAVKLKRTAEYYQWTEQARTETQRKPDGGEKRITTYTYHEKWVPEPVDSSKFHFPGKARNTVLLRVQDEEQIADRVFLGMYALPLFLKKSMSGEAPVAVALTEEARAGLAERMERGLMELREATKSEGRPSGSGRSESGTERIHVAEDVLYLGESPAAPRIGDVRITFAQVKPARISVIAVIAGDTFEPFMASNGKPFHQLSMGDASVDEMLADAKAKSRARLWLLRGIGAALVVFAIKGILRPFAIFADVIPSFGGFAAAGAGMTGRMLGLAWSLAVVAVAWFRFRPLAGIVLFVLSIAFSVALVSIRRGGTKPTN